MKALIAPRRASAYVRLGSGYGGWWVPRWVLKRGNLAYCAGVGEDLTFDAELLAHGMSVVAFDPTPRAVTFARQVDLGPTFDFEAVGWWDSSGTQRFYAPSDPAHVSHSAVNLQKTTEYFVGHVETIVSITERRGDGVPDLVKMDIEGAEYRVLRSMVASRILPGVLCIEFDQPARLVPVLVAIRRLRDFGYRVESMERWNVTLVRHSGDAWPRPSTVCKTNRAHVPGRSL